MAIPASTYRLTAIALSILALALTTNAAPTTYATRVLADAPLGYWRLGESPGATTAADSSGNGNHGTYSPTGVSLGQPGFHGGDTAALFDGRAGRVVVPNSSSLNPPNITMEAKVGWRGPNRLQQRIMEKSSYQELAQYGLSILDDGRVRVEIRTTASPAVNDPICPGWAPAAVVCANSTSLVALNVETHIVATFDGMRIRIYLNGVLDSDTPAGGNAGSIVASPPAPGSTGRDLGIGNQSTRDRGFNGVIDEAVLYGKPLDAAAVKAHFESQLDDQGGAGFQYAVKFVCGKSDERVVAPGEYFTAINVHNPNERGIAFRKKFAIALPGEKPGRVSKFFDARLGPDEAFEIDCPDILRHSDQRASFLKGFAVIETRMPLDVVAVYTAAGASGRVETMDIETVQPRRFGGGDGGKPDLIPVPDAQGNFCRFRDRKFVVTVRNQGTATAGPSTTMVEFSSGTVSQPTPAIPAGTPVDVLFDIPAGCFRPDCGFKITVDSNADVDESNETNNTATGVCIG